MHVSRFLTVFPRLALVLSVLAVLLTTAPLIAVALASRHPVHVVELPGQSFLSRLIVHHPFGFTASWWVLSLIAVSASLGLIRRKLWALLAWIALLVVLLVWSLIVVASEAINLAVVGRQPSPGYLPSLPVAAALTAIPMGCIFAAFRRASTTLQA